MNNDERLRIVTDALREGKSFREIAEALNAEGYRNAKGGPWTDKALREENRRATKRLSADADTVVMFPANTVTNSAEHVPNYTEEMDHNKYEHVITTPEPDDVMIDMTDMNNTDTAHNGYEHVPTPQGPDDGMIGITVMNDTASVHNGYEHVITESEPYDTTVHTCSSHKAPRGGICMDAGELREMIQTMINETIASHGNAAFVHGDEPPLPQSRGKKQDRLYARVTATIDLVLLERLNTESSRRNISLGRLLDTIIWQYYGKPKLSYELDLIDMNKLKQRNPEAIAALSARRKNKGDE